MDPIRFLEKTCISFNKFIGFMEAHENRLVDLCLENYEKENNLSPIPKEEIQILKRFLDADTTVTEILYKNETIGYVSTINKDFSFNSHLTMA